jgi:phosphate transport system permease protein
MSTMTMVIAVPLGLLTAVFLAEWAPAWLDKTLSSMIELLVGIPSVVFGIFGLFVLQGLFRDYINPAISGTLGFIPIFHNSDPSRGTGLLLASSVLAIMVLPTITALSRDAIRGVPREYREASFAVGATKWETIRNIVIPAAFSGILTGIILALMRAMGETMAVIMLVGSVAQVPDSIFSLSTPMTSKIINDIGYHMATDEDRSALFAIGAALFIMEMGFVAAIRLTTQYFSKTR